jgi:hypothetical protein
MKAPKEIEQKYSLFALPFFIAAGLLILHFSITKSWRNEFAAPMFVFFSAFFAGNAYFMHQTKSYFIRSFYSTKSENPKVFAFALGLSVLFSLGLFLLATVPYLVRE